MADEMRGVPIGELPDLGSVPDDSLLVTEFLGKAYSVPGNVLRALIEAVCIELGGSYDEVTEARLQTVIEKVLASGKYNGASPIVEVTENDEGTTVLRVTDAFGVKDYPVTVDGATSAVQYIPQTLTDAQKAQARKNIGMGDVTSVPTKVSQLQNDAGYLTKIPSEYVTEEELEAKGFVTELPTPDLSVNNSADPSYVKGRTHWKETFPGEEIFAAEIPGDSTYKYAAALGLTVGAYYTVVFDGTTYTYVGAEYNDDAGHKGVQLVREGTTVNAPILIVDFTEETAASTGAAGVMRPSPTVSGTVDLSISRLNVVYHTLDENYLPPSARNVPTKVSQLENDSGYLTAVPKGYVTESALTQKGYLTAVPEEYITEDELEEKGYLTKVPGEYVTEAELAQKGFLTAVPSEYVTEKELETKGFLTAVPDEYITEDELEAKGYLTEETNPDLSVNDPNNPAYVKGRTHWLEAINATVVLNNKGVLVSGDKPYYLYKISDAVVVDAESFVGAVVSAYNGFLKWTMNKAERINVSYGNFVTQAYMGDTVYFVSTTATAFNAHMGADLLTEDGTYLRWPVITDSTEVGTLATIETGELHGVISPRFLPPLPEMVGKATGNGSEVFNDYANNVATGFYAHAEGTGTTAEGASHAEGEGTTASRLGHAEGYRTQAIGIAVHSEGYETISSGRFASHAEGYQTKSYGQYGSHAEGHGTEASGDYGSHAEGVGTVSSAYGSHAEGGSTTASGETSHAEGKETTASGMMSHAEGHGTVASGTRSHAEGTQTIAAGDSQHVQGKYNIEDTEGKYAHIVGNGDSTGRSNAHTVDWDGNAWYAGDVYVGGTGQNDKESVKLLREDELDEKLNAKGYLTEVPDQYVTDEKLAQKGYLTKETDPTVPAWAKGKTKPSYTFAEINDKPVLVGENVKGKEYSVNNETKTAAAGAEIFNDYEHNKAVGEYSHAEGSYNEATGDASHAEGNNSVASGHYSHAEGGSTEASGDYGSHAEGLRSTASGGFGSHAEGNSTVASGDASHAEGNNSVASGHYSHAEGTSKATGYIAHAEGGGTQASGSASHSEGSLTKAKGENSHAEGYLTIAAGENQHVQGKHNIEDTENKYAHIVGNGTDANNRSNAHTVDWSGNAWYAGAVTLNGTYKLTAGADGLTLTDTETGKSVELGDAEVDEAELTAALEKVLGVVDDDSTGAVDKDKLAAALDKILT